MTSVFGFWFCLVNILCCELRADSQREFAVDIRGGGKQPGTPDVEGLASRGRAGCEGSAGRALPESHSFTIHVLLAARCYLHTSPFLLT